MSTVIKKGKPIYQFEIERTEHNLHLKFPDSLKLFYKRHGAAILKKDDTVYRVLSPFEIMDVLKHQGVYKYKKYHNHYKDLKLYRLPIIVRDSDDEYFTIGYLFDDTGKIFDYDKAIALTIKDFAKN